MQKTIALVSWGAAALLLCFAPGSARADASVGVSARADNFGQGGLVDARLRIGANQLGLDVYAGHERKAFISGFAVEDALRVDVHLRGLWQVWQQGPARFSLLTRAGARSFSAATGNAPESASWAVSAEMGALVHADVHPRAVARFGVLVPLLFQLDPAFSNDVNGALLSLGIAVALRDQLLLTANLNSGGIFGADGDAGKFLVQGTLGVRWAPKDWRYF